MPSFIPYAIVQSGVKRGLLGDSIRRQLQRLGVKQATSVLRSLYPRAVEEFANQAFLEEQPDSYVPRKGSGMIDRPFPEPWANNYVVNVEFQIDGTGPVLNTDFTVKVDRDYSLGELEAAAVSEAQRMVREGGESGVAPNARIIGAKTVNAFSNL